MSLVLAVGTIVGTVASVLALWLTVKTKRRRFATALDNEIKDAVWQDFFAYFRQHPDWFKHSYSGSEIRDFQHKVWEGDNEIPTELWNEAVRVVHLSLKLRLASRAASPPHWALRLLPPADAHRYNLEWGAHLHELADQGAWKQARADRSRFALLAVALALVLRARQAARRS